MKDVIFNFYLSMAELKDCEEQLKDAKFTN